MQENIKKQMLRERKILVKAYREVQARRHPHFRTVKDLAKYHRVSRKFIWGLARRYDEFSGDEDALRPRKRGPKRPWNRPSKEMERLVVNIHRRLGKTPVQIHFMLVDRNIRISVSGIRNILGRYPLPDPIREVTERYEKKLPGELGHIDIKKLPNIQGENPQKKFYEAALMDDCTRITYRERLPNKKAKTLAQFLCCALAWFQAEHQIKFKKILSDNGKEFTTHSRSTRWFHCFELALRRHGISHAYTRPYRPQTNGKVERFWRIWNEEFVSVHRFRSWSDYDEHARLYLRRYNYERRHGGIFYQKPVDKLNNIRNNSIVNFEKVA